MNEHIGHKRLNLIFRDLADELDVPPSKYPEPTDHYEAVAAWLDVDNPELAHYQPSIYPRGSFVLDTAVKPLGDKGFLAYQGAPSTPFAPRDKDQHHGS